MSSVVVLGYFYMQLTSDYSLKETVRDAFGNKADRLSSLLEVNPVITAANSDK